MKVHKKNIIYFLPADDYPSGGAKTIYNHSNIINKLGFKNFSSSIVHYKKKKSSKFILSIKKRIFDIKNLKNYGYLPDDFKIVKDFTPKKSWIDIKINHKNNLKFNPKTDFIIFPEIISHFAKKFSKTYKIKYAIFVLGVYHMNQTSNVKLFNEVYKKSSFIIDISDNTRKALSNIIFNYKKKIIRTTLSVNPKAFKNAKKKINLITCMPRKLREDFNLLRFFTRNIIPKSWKILLLENMSNKEISKNLAKSKIFLSFSNFEGLGLPPLEAALSGNKIIGYSGGAGDEYFKKPIFEKILKGDIYNFANKLKENILTLKKNWHLQKDILYQKKKILKKYSLVNEKKGIIKILTTVDSILKKN